MKEKKRKGIEHRTKNEQVTKCINKMVSSPKERRDNTEEKTAVDTDISIIEVDTNKVLKHQIQKIPMSIERGNIIIRYEEEVEVIQDNELEIGNEVTIEHTIEEQFDIEFRMLSMCQYSKPRRKRKRKE